jgi:hypothetical protein
MAPWMCLMIALSLVTIERALDGAERQPHVSDEALRFNRCVRLALRVAAIVMIAAGAMSMAVR